MRFVGRLRVERVGALVTVQDRGRPGFAHLGVGRSGAADLSAHDAANRLVGNDPAAATLEILLGGLRVRADGPATVAVTGARVPLSVNGVPHGDHSVVRLSDGDVLDLGRVSGGLRSYLAVRGGVDVPPTLGSRATDTLAGLGPNPVRAGDRLPVGSTPADWPAWDLLPSPAAPHRPAVLRVRLGPRDDMFDAAAVGVLTGQEWTVTAETNRVGARLNGPIPLTRSSTGELPSEGMAAGAIQVPTGGQPVLFLADHPVTGGYPVIAVVTAADVGTAAQLAPGERLRFTTIA